jgi:hypothetical protein
MRKATSGGVTKDGWNGWRLEDWPAGEFGGWHIVYGGDGGYPMDMDRFRSSAVVLDGIMQVAKKAWATDACIAGLVRALNDIL